MFAMTWSLIFLSYSTLFALGLGDNIRGSSFSEILHTFQISNSIGSWLFAIASFMGIWGSFSSHLYLRRMKRVTALQISMLLFACGLLLMGSAPKFWLLLVGAALFGYSVGLMAVMQNILVSLGSSKERQPQIISGLHAMYGFASLLAPLLVATAGAYFGWRSSFYIAAFIPFSLLIYTFFQDRSDARDVDTVDHSRPVDLNANDSIAESDDSFHQRSIFGVPKSCIYIGISLAAYVVVEIMVSSRLAHFLREVYHFNLQTSALYVTYFFCFLLAGRIVFALVKVPLSVATQLFLALWFSLIFLILGIYLSPLFFCLTGLSMSPCYPLSMLYISRHFPRQLDKAVGFTVTLQQTLLVIMQFVIGSVSDRYGVNYSFYVGLFFLFLAIGFLFLFERTKAKLVTS